LETQKTPSTGRDFSEHRESRDEGHYFNLGDRRRRGVVETKKENRHGGGEIAHVKRGDMTM